MISKARRKFWETVTRRQIDDVLAIIELARTQQPEWFEEIAEEQPIPEDIEFIEKERILAERSRRAAEIKKRELDIGLKLYQMRRDWITVRKNTLWLVGAVVAALFYAIAMFVGLQAM